MNGEEELPEGLSVKKGAVKENPKKFKCKICRKVYADKYYLRTHVQIHADLCSFKCDLCPYEGKLRKYLMRHKKKCHSKPTSNECKFCGKKFHYKSALIRHSWVHTGEKPYECEICGKAFNTKYSLNNHVLIHTDEKPFQCMYCEYACRDSSTLSKHHARHTGTERMYECKKCNKRYKMKWKLKEHVASAHLDLDIRKYECDQCGKIFTFKTNLRNHIQAVHERRLACACSLCGARLSHRGNLREHMRRHVDARPYACAHGGCPHTFKTTSELRKHSVLHCPERQHACARCGRRYPRRRRRDAHALRCTATARTGFRCDHCALTFHSKRLLSAHIKSHSVMKEEFHCDACQYVAYDRANITNHMRNEHRNHQETRCDASRVLSENPILENAINEDLAGEVKLEPFDTESGEVVDFCHVDGKREVVGAISEDEDTDGNESGTVTERHANTAIEENLNNLKRVPERMFDEFYIGSVLKKHVNEAVKNKKRSYVDAKKIEYVEECIKKLLGRSEDVPPTRARPGRLARDVTEQKKEADKTWIEDGVSANTRAGIKQKGKRSVSTVTSARSLQLNLHQCYVCFKLFPTKAQLLDHCKDHFDVCSETMLTRCPLCQYVTKKHIKRHMSEKHDLDLDIHVSRIKEKTNDNGSSRYYLEVDDTVLEVIPSVKNLNKMESMKLDKRRRKLRDKFVGTTKLVKKGREWVVENKEINEQEYILPAEFPYSDDGEYLEKIREFSSKAKKEGKKMLFPCNACEKKCQTLSALKLHFRRHEKNPKPFKPKRWKHKGQVKEKTVMLNRNRLERPKPIVGKHKCDESLMEFYKNNIRGGDIEFWQFLKIYNRMSRENVQGFEDLEARTDFGIHVKHVSEAGPAERTKIVKRDGSKIAFKESERVNPRRKKSKTL